MKTTQIQSNPHKKLQLTPAQVIAKFSATYTLEEVQRRLWELAFPALLESLQVRHAAQTNQLVAFHEHLEQLLIAVYHTHATAVEETKPPNSGQVPGDSCPTA